MNEQLIIPVPPVNAFSYDPANAPLEDTDPLLLAKAQHEHLPIIEKVVGAGREYEWKPDGTYTDIGPADYAPSKNGWYIYHIGQKYPQPGFPFPDALHLCEPPKRHLVDWVRVLTSKEFLPLLAVFAILPRKWKVKIVEKFILQYLQLSEEFLKRIYLKPDFYNNTSLEIKGFLFMFLTNLGISMHTANRFAFTFATMIEYDSAYRLRIVDLLSETTKEKMLKDPVGEAARLVKILGERDNRKHLVEKFGKFVTLLRYSFFFIAKPFRNALKEIEFEKLQYDDIDRHYVKHWTGYNFFGKTIEERLKEYPMEYYKKFQLDHE